MPPEAALGFFQGYEGAMWLDDHINGREPPRCPWVPRLLRHLYGDEEAASLIALAVESHGR